METGINIVSKEEAYISTDDRSLICRLNKLIAASPEGVKIIAKPEDNDGCFYGIIPANWVKLSLPRKLTDEQKAELAERAKPYAFRKKAQEEAAQEEK